MALNPQADLRSLFDQAIDLPPIPRADLLREVQFKSPLLYRELRELLLAHEGSHEFFDEFEREGNLWSQFSPPSLLGRRFGSYVIESELGRGGMGAVYKATRADDVFYKTVAIKVIAGGAALSESALDAFRRERQILAQLEHPHIARLLDAGATPDGLLYLVMEYVDGQPLDVYIASHKLSVEAILRIFLDVCEAVAFAHRNLVIHRDLKPSNILVDRSGQVKLLDFGIAKVLSPGRAVTATVAVRLTPEFASPEHIRGTGVSTVSDVYSLGVVLFHLLTGGARPYRTTSQAVPDLLNAVLESDVPRPSSVAPAPLSKQLQGDLDNIILKAMAKEPARRYASVEKLEEDIRRHLSGRPVLARPATFTYRALKFWQRNRLAVAAAFLLLLAISSGVWSTLRQAEIAQRERANAERARASAEQARQRAEAQRQRAETQSQLALEAQANEAALRQVAEAERSIAESRYQNARSLAGAILNDVNDSLKALPGSESARRQALLAALKHLEALGQKSTNDLDLLEDLARAYEQTGELMRSLTSDGPEQAMFALPALEKGYALRQRIATARPREASATLALSASERLLGNGYYSTGQRGRAMEHYRTSLRLLEPFAALPAARNLAALAHSNLCTAYAESGGPGTALVHCRQAASHLQAIEPHGSRLLNLRLREADLLQLTRQFPDALATLRLAYLSLDPAQPAAAAAIDRIQKSAKTIPQGNVLAAQSLRVLAVLQARSGNRDQALENFEQSLRLLGSPSPAMRDVLTYAEYAEKLPDPRHLSPPPPPPLQPLLSPETSATLKAK